MQSSRYILSQFYSDSTGALIPVAADYGTKWLCPTYPATATGWALVLINIAPHQLDATTMDDRIVVCPLVFDPSPVPDLVVTTYASMGATTGMSMGALMATLAATEPIYGTQNL